MIKGQKELLKRLKKPEARRESQRLKRLEEPEAKRARGCRG